MCSRLNIFRSTLILRNFLVTRQASGKCYYSDTWWKFSKVIRKGFFRNVKILSKTTFLKRIWRVLSQQPFSRCFYVHLQIFFIYAFKKNLINHKVMLHVVLGRFSTLEFNELKSEQYLSQNHSFQNQGLSPFQVPDIIKTWFNIICFI